MVPAVDDIQNVQHYAKDPESIIFHKVNADIDKRHDVWKGFYIFTPSGIRLFSMTCHRGGGADPCPDGTTVPGEGWDGHGLITGGRLNLPKFEADPKVIGLRKALERYAALPKAQRLLPATWKPGGRDRRELPLDNDPNGLLVRVISRRLPSTPVTEQTPHQATENTLWRWNTEWATWNAQEAQAWLPSDEEGRDLPRELFESVVRNSLVDSTGGQAGSIEAKDISTLKLRSTRIGVNGELLTLRIDGEIASTAFIGRALGYAQYRRDIRRFTAFQLALVGTKGKATSEGRGYFLSLSAGPIERTLPSLTLAPKDANEARDARAARNAERPATAPPAAPSVRREPDAATLAIWNQRLHERLVAKVATGRGPAFLMTVFNTNATVLSLDAKDTLTLRLAQGGEITAAWRTLSHGDRRNLAVALHQEYDADSHALNAFFHLLVGDRIAAEKDLAQAGPAAAEIRALFTAP